MIGRARPLMTAPRFTPLAAALIGAAGGAVDWLAAQIWPASIAVVLSIFATTLLSGAAGLGAARAADLSSVGFVFGVLVKYSALMALSAANLPFALPANLSLGFILIAGFAASRALTVSASKPVTHADVGIALAIGFAPAALIGIPGLAGLAAAIVARMLFAAYVRRGPRVFTAAALETTAQLTEVCFYLGALATWAYI